MFKTFKLFIFAALFFVPSVLAEQPSYQEELVQRALELSLDEKITWNRLVQYKPRLFFPGVKSLVDDLRFFFAPDGKTNPRTELEATIRAFFIEGEPTDPQAQHPQCAFPGRFHWLKTQLQFDASRLPEKECVRFREWRDSLNPFGVTLIYPAAYLNNPASMFGHTLLRIDSPDQTEATRLLAYGANYAANTGERSGIVFAARGIFGGYDGIFSVAPYYKLVNMYSDLENRDIWEYRLDLTPDEVEQAVRHLWELGLVSSDYYFFDENCAYQLLAVLEATREDLSLTDAFPAQAIPSDTVREVANTPGLVKEIIYRPASATMVSARLNELPQPLRLQALAISRGEISPDAPELSSLSNEQRARVLELAFEYLNYRRQTGRAPGDDVPRRARELLTARSKVDITLPPVKPPTPSVRPEQGHSTARMSISGGSEDGEAFYELGYRPAYHDLLDPPGGYVRGADLRFFDLALRHYEGDNLELERLRPLSITSLTPRNEFFKPLSWRISGGAEREPLPGHVRGALAYLVEGGSGLTYALGPDVLLSTFVELNARYNPDYPEEEYALGAGPSVSLLWNNGEGMSTFIQAKSVHALLGEEHRIQSVRIEQRYSLTKEIAVRASFAHTFAFGDYENEVQAGIQLYH